MNYISLGLLQKTMVTFSLKCSLHFQWFHTASCLDLTQNVKTLFVFPSWT